LKLPPPRATLVIAAATVACFVLVSLSGFNEVADVRAGFIPARLSGILVANALPVAITPLTATLLHGGALHLGFNLLMLIFCGKMVETAIGPWGLVILYVAGAYVSAAAQFFAGPLDLSPMIGASGAISAIFGGYALLFSEPKLFLSRPLLAKAVNVVWLALAWMGLQYLMGLATVGTGMAIATPAHVGGFLAGLILTRPLLLLRFRGA